MLFNSYTFLIFFAIVYALYRGLPGWTSRKALLLLASYGFYAWWNPPFTLLLITSTIVDFIAGGRIAQNNAPRKRALWLTLSLCVNLGVLAAFKYGNFLAGSFGWLTQWIGFRWQYQHQPWNIVLPLGISFYTFQSMSYTIDIYRKRLPPTDNLLNFALYVTFFPQLVAGPIVRATDFLWQTEKKPELSSAAFAWGLCLFVWGMFKKVVLADNVAVVVNEIFAAPGKAGILDSWIATYGFAIQIYCDFSGYSHMAIGIALMLGFHIPDNFHRPYGALGFSEFWQRWHISLSSYLRDYLYIPLGGNRKGQTRTYLNLMLTMLLGGLWHGANWTFVVWGGLHGLYLAIERFLLQALSLPRNAAARLRLVPRFLVCVGVFHLTCLAWVFFRAQTFQTAWSMVSNMLLFGNSFLLAEGRLFRKTAIVGIVGVLVLWHFLWRGRTETDLARRLPDWILAAITAVLVILCALAGGNSNEFIYFQF